MIRNLYKVFLLVVCLSVSAALYAQSGNAYGEYSPYSVFGIGEISKEGTAFNKSMGGVGIATRNKRYINYMNPAAVTARDSLSFMADFGLSQKNDIYSQKLDGNRLTSGNNTFNIYDVVFSFPIYRSSAFMLGIAPFSNVGYDFSRKDVYNDMNLVTKDKYYGEGSIYQVFAGAGVTFWKRLSVGAQAIGYFGTLEKSAAKSFTDGSIRSNKIGNTLLVRGFTGKFGVQYDQPVGDGLRLTVGATYRLATSMKGTNTYYEYAVQSGISDTVKFDVMKNSDRLKIGDELGLGVSLRGGDKWSVEFDYLRSDWYGTNIDAVDGFRANGFKAVASQSFRAGFEIVPNRNDIRYYMRRCAYRAGVYYDQAYYKFNGNRVNSFGLTLGMTLPVFRLYNGLTIGVDMGQKGSLKNGMVRERYASFVIGFNIHDLWFQKPRYE